MVQKTMILVAAKHKEWVEIVLSFGCKQETAEDIVQEMYYKIQLKLEKGLDIMYNEKEINYYYIFKTLRTLFYDLKRKGKNITMVSMDDIHLTTTDVNFKEPYDKIQNELSKMFWYDRKVFEIINQGESIAEFSRKSLIHYYSLYNTYNKVKSKLKKTLMTEKFYRNLKTGKEFEEKALQIIHKKYPQAYIIDGNYKEWDIYIPELDMGIEVKSDAQHKSTGNYFLEYYCRNKASGISSTKAEYFFIYLDELYIIKTDTLRDIFLKYKGTNKDKIGGDDRKSLGIIISLKELKYETR